MMIHFVAPLGGKIIGKAASHEVAWWLCNRYGLAPHPLTDASVVDLDKGARDIAHNPNDEWEVTALENGLSVRAYRGRVQAGCPEAVAATMGLGWRKW